MKWTIIDEKLYLNYNIKVQGEWFADKVEIIKKAEKTG